MSGIHAQPAGGVYSEDFFSSRRVRVADSASVIVPIVHELTECKSVVDVGCGTGTWLAAFANAGIGDLLGIDGDYVDASQLEIPASQYVSRDLSKPFAFDRKFDLAVCLEVAEHLPEACAPGFVDCLCALSDIVLFSAAIPHQGGTGHINLQWQSYWAGLFRLRNFVVIDCIRPAVWRDQRVSYWYAQNSLLFVHERTLENHERLRTVSAGTSVMDVVHPWLFEDTMSRVERLRAALQRNAGSKAAIRHAIGTVAGALRRRLWAR